MDPSAILAYMATLGALTLTPGPLIAVLAARSAGRDRPGACAMVVGICAGDALVILAICAGFGFWLQAHPQIYSFARYAGAALLLWLALRLWISATAQSAETCPAGGIAASLLVGFALCLSSPQTVVMYLVLLPRVVDLTALGVADLLLLLAATIVALVAVFVVVILFAEATQALLRSTTGARLWARAMALTLVLSAGWIVLAAD